MDLTPFVETPRSCTLLQAPPAWGKTRMLLSQMEKSSGVWLFLSPLRALAEEFYSNCRSRFSAHLIRRRSDWRDIPKSSGKNHSVVIVTTPESLALENSPINFEKVRVIVDEFHLFFLWGSSFRPQMWESLLGLACRSFSLVALSATVNESVKREWRRDFPLAFDTLVEIDLGNQRFKYRPARIHYFLPWGSWGQASLNRRFLKCLLRPSRGVVLYFCRYRAQVDAWLGWCRRRGISALGCKGGEVLDFVSSLDHDNPPRVIFATSALGHGVNLPAIEKVFISYKTEDRDFWLQMASRGGRDGRPFELHTLDSFHTSILERGVSLLTNAITDVWVRLYLFLKIL